MLLAPAIAFLAADGLARGFAPWEKTIAGRAVDGAAGRPFGSAGDTNSAGGSGDAAGLCPFAAPRHDGKRRVSASGILRRAH